MNMILLLFSFMFFVLSQSQNDTACFSICRDSCGIFFCSMKSVCHGKDFGGSFCFKFDICQRELVTATSFLIQTSILFSSFIFSKENSSVRMLMFSDENCKSHKETTMVKNGVLGPVIPVKKTKDQEDTTMQISITNLQEWNEKLRNLRGTNDLDKLWIFQIFSGTDCQPEETIISLFSSTPYNPPGWRDVYDLHSEVATKGNPICNNHLNNESRSASVIFVPPLSFFDEFLKWKWKDKLFFLVLLALLLGMHFFALVALVMLLLKPDQLLWIQNQYRLFKSGNFSSIINSVKSWILGVFSSDNISEERENYVQSTIEEEIERYDDLEFPYNNIRVDNEESEEVEEEGETPTSHTSTRKPSACNCRDDGNSGINSCHLKMKSFSKRDEKSLVTLTNIRNVSLSSDGEEVVEGVFSHEDSREISLFSISKTDTKRPLILKSVTTIANGTVNIHSAFLLDKTNRIYLLIFEDYSVQTIQIEEEQDWTFQCTTVSDGCLPYHRENYHLTSARKLLPIYDQPKRYIEKNEKLLVIIMSERSFVVCLKGEHRVFKCDQVTSKKSDDQIHKYRFTLLFNTQRVKHSATISQLVRPKTEPDSLLILCQVKFSNLHFVIKLKSWRSTNSPILKIFSNDSRPPPPIEEEEEEGGEKKCFSVALNTFVDRYDDDREYIVKLEEYGAKFREIVVLGLEGGVVRRQYLEYPTKDSPSYMRYFKIGQDEPFEFQIEPVQSFREHNYFTILHSWSILRWKYIGEYERMTNIQILRLPKNKTSKVKLKIITQERDGGVGRTDPTFFSGISWTGEELLVFNRRGFTTKTFDSFVGNLCKRAIKWKKTLPGLDERERVRFVQKGILKYEERKNNDRHVLGGCSCSVIVFDDLKRIVLPDVFSKNEVFHVIFTL